jgi:hypothetical protein
MSRSELITPMYRERVGKCDDCGDNDLLASHDNDYLCHDCWHRARERGPGYALVRVESGYPVGINGIAMTVTLQQALLMLAKEVAIGYHVYEIREWHWTGERMAHPAYGVRRRAALVAQHPEYA